MFSLYGYNVVCVQMKLFPQQNVYFTMYYSLFCIDTAEIFREFIFKVEFSKHFPYQHLNTGLADKYTQPGYQGGAGVHEFHSNLIMEDFFFSFSF